MVHWHSGAPAPCLALLLPACQDGAVWHRVKKIFISWNILDWSYKYSIVAPIFHTYPPPVLEFLQSSSDSGILGVRSMGSNVTQRGCWDFIEEIILDQNRSRGSLTTGMSLQLCSFWSIKRMSDKLILENSIYIGKLNLGCYCCAIPANNKIFLRLLETHFLKRHKKSWALLGVFFVMLSFYISSW